ncbi:hypothetical protein TWF694_004089 [Orbilia ellipsospora]|uniref:Reverse transcriptase domain-containing protein n=1 Tax=Orbilia ellipsospora TaxID=2528407 RepID=A0AAV9WX24_9PEZI
MKTIRFHDLAIFNTLHSASFPRHQLTLVSTQIPRPKSLYSPTRSYGQNNHFNQITTRSYQVQTAMASSDGLSETLHAVTRIKLAELDKQSTAYENAKKSLLKDAANKENIRDRIRFLADGAEKLPTMTSLADNPILSLKNLKRFADQADRDPSVSQEFLEDYEKTIRDELSVQTNKYAFASLYGQLVNEWISAGKAAATNESSADWIPVGREEMHKQRATWEGYVFNAKETDTAAIKSYLEDLFTKNPSKDVKFYFERLRESVRDKQKDWDSSPFNPTVVSQTINSILRTDIISDKKRATLKDFLGNDVVLKEIADVLNMRMASRNSFAWEGVSTIEQRRQLNGRYRFYPDEDLLQGIFLQYIGLEWATFWRGILVNFAFGKGVLKIPPGGPTEKEIERRCLLSGEKYDADRDPWALGRNGGRNASIESELRAHWKNEIFLDQLPCEKFERRGGYGKDQEKGDTRTSPLEVVQKLLYRLQALIMINKRLGKDVTVIRSDFQWFGPSLPHSSIFTVLEFFGVNEEWLSFFRKILEAPTLFVDDAPETTPRNRLRGTPIGVPIATFFGEALLFVGDFAVNQKADGARLYRLHDDIWLWGDVDTCERGWTALKEVSSLMGLEFNKTKTGCVRISSDTTSASSQSPLPESLPKGDVVWGFLKLDPESGTFVINQEKVDSHIEELSLQLKACKSVFDFTQAWNIYGSRYFQTNCGRVANCISLGHVDSRLETFQRIQGKVFGSATGGVGTHLKQMIMERFGVSDIPDGYLYFPLKLGGLEVQNPFIKLYLVRDQLKEKPEKVMDEFFEKEERDYDGDKRNFERLRSKESLHYMRLVNETYLTFEEYTKHREYTSSRLNKVFTKLMAEPEVAELDMKSEIQAVLKHTTSGGDRHMTSGRNRRNRQSQDQWTSYEKWIIQLYSKEMMRRFGGLNIVEEGLLPMGLITMLRESRFKWQG